MDDRTNTIAGWVLAGAAVALGLTIVTGEYFRAERPEKMGYVVEGVEEEVPAGGAAAPAQPVEFYLASADPAKGEQVFKKCAACHNADNGGPNALGPNLWGVLGEPIGQGRGFAFSDALKSKGGAWDWKSLDAWLTSPKAYAPGTKMTFAGLSKPEDRADVIAFLNAHSNAPLPLPAAPAEAPAAAAGTAAEAGEGAKTQPVVTEGEAAANPAGTVTGEGAPTTSGTASQERK